MQTLHSRGAPQPVKPNRGRDLIPPGSRVDWDGHVTCGTAIFVIPAQELSAILGPGGQVARAHPSYEHRPGQIRMAQAVAQAIEERCHLCVEAGTGTGKTLAYLLPAITVDAATNRLQSYTTVWWGNPSAVTYGYDAAGNSITRGSRSVAWDGAGRLKQVWQPSDGSVYGSYRYDALGRRVKKSWNYLEYSWQRMESVVYVYGAGGEVLAEYRDDAGGNYGPEASTAYNVHMGSTLVARRVTGTLSGNPYAGTEWLHRNHLQEVVGADYSNMSA
jgi:hypothetical protein